MHRHMRRKASDVQWKHPHRAKSGKNIRRSHPFSRWRYIQRLNHYTAFIRPLVSILNVRLPVQNLSRVRLSSASALFAKALGIESATHKKMMSRKFGSHLFSPKPTGNLIDCQLTRLGKLASEVLYTNHSYLFQGI